MKEEDKAMITKTHLMTQTEKHKEKEQKKKKSMKCEEIQFSSFTKEKHWRISKFISVDSLARKNHWQNAAKQLM